MADMLQRNGGLRTLNLGSVLEATLIGCVTMVSNLVGTESGKRICSALAQNRTLTVLSLGIFVAKA